MANELRIPVKLDVLQSSIGDLQKILNNLQPNTAGYKAIEKIIQSMVQESQKLQVQLSRPFTNEGQFRTANKTIEKLEDSAARISVIMNGLKFSDLKLTPEQQASFEKLNREIDDIRTNYQQLTNQVKQSVLSNANNESLVTSLLGSKTLSADFAQIRAEVDKHISELEEKQAKLQSIYEKLKSNADLASRAKILTSQEGGITRESIGQSLFDKYLWQNGDQMGFKLLPGQTKEAFIKELEQVFNLDEGTLKDLASKSFNQINETFKSMGQKGNMNPFQGLISAFGSNKIQSQLVIDKQNLSDLANQINQYKQLQIELNTLQNQKIDPADTEAQGRIAALTQEMSKLEDQILQTATSSPTVKKPLTEIGNQANYLKNSLEQCNVQFLRMQKTTQSFNQMKMAVVNFMGFSQVLNLTKRAIKDAINHIKELDSVMNKISIVTDMSTADLWNQVDAYSKMAQTYGVSIKGAYEVSQIYYQQGLATNDVLTLTNETLKLAKVSGLDYASTTDYMTTALRGFKMEMSEASTVVDVYSNLAAHTAVTQEELAVAMSKTASSMESVGSTFEESSAMIATMVAVTRESSVNIGSALKSIAARYGEMKKDPGALVDADGEVMAYNKVDAALQSVGISLKTADGQFREFTDVIIELGEKWEELDSIQQRYIATQFAGNRQQSRFLALVSNVDLLKSNLNYAENAEDTGTLQALKALDSIESKIEQVRVAYQQFYTTIGVENVWKGLLDGTKNVINTLNRLPKLFGKIPASAIMVISNIISLIKSFAFKALSTIAQNLGKSIASGIKQGVPEVTSAAQTIVDTMQNVLKKGETEAAEAGKNTATNYANGAANAVKNLTPSQLTGDKKTQYDQKQATIEALTKYDKSQTTNDVAERMAREAQQNGLITSAQFTQLTADRNNTAAAVEHFVASLRQEQDALLQSGDAAVQSSNKFVQFAQSHQKLGSSLISLGYALNMIGALFDTADEGGRAAAATFMGVAGSVQLIGAAIKALDHQPVPWMLIASGIISLINGISLAVETNEEKLERFTKKAEELGNTAKQLKSDYRNLDINIKKLDELEEKRHESAEAAEEYQEAVDDLAKKFPELISGFDDAGNVIIHVTDAEDVLAKAREASAKATYEAAQAELDVKEQEIKNKKDTIKNSLQRQQDNINVGTNRSDFLYEKLLERYTAYGFADAAMAASGVSRQGESLSKEQFEQIATSQDIDLNEFYSGMGAFERITELAENMLSLEDITSEQGYAYYDEIKTLLKSVDDHDMDLSGWGDTINELNGLLKDYEELLGQRGGLRRAVISAWQKTSTNKEGKAWKYTDSTALSSVLADRVQNQLEITTDENGEKLKATEENYQKLAEEDQEALDNFYKFLNEDQVEQLEKIFSDTSNMSVADIEQAFGDTQGWTSQIYTLFSDFYSGGIESIQTRLKNNLKNKAGYDRNTEFNDVESELRDNEFYNSLIESINTTSTNVEEQYLNTVLNTYQSMANKGLTSYAGEYGESALGLFELVSTLGGDLEKSIWSIIKEKGTNTISGIEEIITAIKNISGLEDGDKEAIENYLLSMEGKLSRNLNLEIQTMTSDLLENWEDKTKDLSKAIGSGVTLKEADSLIQQAKSLNLDKPITLDDFQLVNDKLVLTREAYKSYYEGLVASNLAAADRIQGFIDDADDIQFDLIQETNFANKWKETYEKYTFIADNLGVDLQSYLQADGSISTEGVQALKDAIAKNAEDVARYNVAAQIAGSQLNDTIDRANGEYKLDGELLDQKALEEIVSSTTLGQEGKDAQKRVIKNSITEVYDKFISDTLSKGFQNININDYKGLLKDTTISIDEGYEAFVKKYVSLTGKTVDEVNDLVLQARAKDRETKSEDLIKDATFISENIASMGLDTLGNIANAFDVSITKLLDSSAVTWNEALQEYTVDIQKLAAEGIDLSQIDNYTQLVQESIEALFKNIASAISSAIGGSLDVKGKKNLTDTLSRLGIDTNLSFTRTAEGLKLSLDSATKLYDELNKIDSLQASLVFKEMAEALKKSDEHYKSISANEARIVELQSKLKAGNVDLAAHARNRIPGEQMRAAGWNVPLDSYSTLYSSTYSGEKFGTNVVLNVTPITNDGTVIKNPEELDQYVEQLLTGGGTAKDILARDVEGLVMGAWDVSDVEKFGEAMKRADEEAVRLHEESAELSDDFKSVDNPNDARIKQYERELELAKQIKAERSTTEDSSFDFMSGKIPGAQNNPLKYFESWGKAWATLRDSFKGKGKDKGKIEYEDFYNIVTEMGNIAQKSGQKIEFGAGNFISSAEDAAAMIEKGAQCLTVATDGSIKVDLSKFGLDFSSGADDLAKNVNAGIREMAHSQVQMLDGMIQLMETIVAMEEIGNIDTNGNNQLDLGEIFSVVDGVAVDWSENWPKAAEKIKKLAEESPELTEALESVKVNGETLASLFDQAGEKWEWAEGKAEAYQAVMNAFYQAAISGNYDTENILASIKEVLAGSGYEGTIEVAGMKLQISYDAAFEIGEDGKIHAYGQTFEDNPAGRAAASKLIHAKELAGLSDAVASYDNTSKTVKVEDNLVAEVDYNVEDGSYNVKFSDGTTAFSETKEGISLAIATYAKIKPDEAGTVQVTGDDSKPITFTIQQEGQVKTEFTVTDGKVTVEGNKDFEDEAQSAVDEWTGKLIEKVDTTTTSTEATAQVMDDATDAVSAFAEAVNSIDASPLEQMADATTTILNNLPESLSPLNAKIPQIFKPQKDQNKPEEQSVILDMKADTSKADSSIKKMKESVEEEPAVEVIEGEDKATEVGEDAQAAINNMRASIKITASNSATGVINNIKSALDELVSGGPYRVNVEAKVAASGGGGGGSGTSYMATQATGNVGTAKAAGTLMGELGPELVVSNGRYFVAGQRGPEMVNLANDAIVFNHLQTKSLLERGMSSTRGRAVTNERNAVAYAHGNINGGPAKASASAALAALKQLQAMWKALESIGVKDLAGKGGGGGGGGGKDKTNAWITQVERWYNLMQKIAQLEKDITHEQTLRSKIQSDINRSGKAYFKSQVEELQALQQELVAQEALNISKTDYFKQRREQLNTDKNNPFNQLYQFDENGQLKYNDKLKIKGADGQTKTGAFNFLSDLMSQAPNGKAKYTSEQQYNALVAAGFGDYMKYNQNSEEIPTKDGKPEDYATAVEAFWDAVEAQKEEMQTLHDDIEEGNNKTLELQQKQNEILQQMRDNQMSVENAVLKAIESQRQRAIDKLSDERKALEESSQKYIQGLSDALSKERDLYNQNESSEELNKMRRQLAILQRSGGSGADIRNLQNSIRNTERDMYFAEQQRQIDAIQEASDKQLEKMQDQIDLMTETLEYQKTFGLLWADVYQIMNENSAENIAAFIQANDQEMWGSSPLKTTEEMREALFQAEQWTSLRECQDNMFADQQMANAHQEETISAAVYGTAARDWPVFDEAMSTVYGNKWDKQAAKYEEKFGAKVSQSQDITDAREQITGALNNLTTAVTGALPKPSSVSGVGGSSGSGSSTSSSSNGNSGKGKKTPTVKNIGGYEWNASKHWKTRTWSDGHKDKVEEGPHRWKWTEASNGYRWDKVCSICGYTGGYTYSNPNNKTSGGCFAAGTKITMADYTEKNIEDIKVGDLVLSYNISTKELVKKPVIQCYVHENTARLIRVTLEDDSILELTPSHPILTTEGWKSRDWLFSMIEEHEDTKWLEEGDIVIRYDNLLKIKTIEEIAVPDNYTTFNFKVEDTHTYIANGTVVHNMVTKYAEGGLNRETGLAMLHGTSNAPEAVFNPAQTKILRDNILSNKPNSLISLLETYNAAYNNGISPAGVGENIVIENVSVNMNVSEIANDYDARRAGAQALDEMLNIARKTSARNSIRR